MKNKRANKAVSNIVGTLLLLGMAIALFSIVQIIAFSIPYNPNPPSARLTGYIDISPINDDSIYIVHHGGESLPLDTIIIFTIDNGNAIEKTANELIPSYPDDPDPNFWDIGERARYFPDPPYNDLSNIPIEIVVVDIESNSIMMQSTIQE